ncbi:trypsin-like serine protease [uncultured Sphingomonas sp.]|uniref:trypsin-like serine protease n=1 Tax=uncultured Sphingomonas sp. TaxID=158754 RepID=UPI0035C9AFF4
MIGAIALLAASPALAQTEVSGERDGYSWTARSSIVAAVPTSTGLTGGGGSPLFYPSSDKSGVVALIMQYANGSAFICSGSLLADRQSILTAGHCVSSGAGTGNPMKTTAYFYNGNPDVRTPFQTVGTAIDVTDYFVNSKYTGQVVDQNDIAVLRLASAAPNSAQAYSLFTGGNLTGDVFNVAGYGQRSTVGGALGGNAQTGYLREGYNSYDYALGDPRFGGFFTNIDPAKGTNFFGTADIALSFVSDFDNGLQANDAAGLIGRALTGSSVFFNAGLGALEVDIAGGDSGGPEFVNGQIASVSSYSLSFGKSYGDIDATLDSSFGEFAGFVPTYIHADWINSLLVSPAPEPGTWMMMIVGFGLAGGVLRRRPVAGMRMARA